MGNKKSPEELVEEIVASMQDVTGKKFNWWVKHAKKDGPDKQMACVKWLKENHGLKHYVALVIAAEAVGNSMRKSYSDPDKLLTNLYSGKKDHLRPAHDAAAKLIMGLGKDVSDRVCKTYVSYFKANQFAIVHPATQKLVDINLVLPKDTEADGVIEACKNSPGGERFNFRIRIGDASELDAAAKRWIKLAYKSAKG